MMKIIRKIENPELFDELKEKFLKKKDYPLCLYTKSAEHYYKTKSEDEGFDHLDKSFIVINECDPCFLFIGVLKSRNNFERLSFYDLPSIILEIKKLTRSECKSIASYIKEISSNLSIIDMSSEKSMSIVLDELSWQNSNVKLDFYYHRIIDLDSDVDKIKASIRKRYISLINKSKRLIDFKIWNSQNIDHEVFMQCRDLHISVSGRETRSKRTWDCQYDAISKDDAFLITGMMDGKLVTFGYFLTSSNHCYYGVSASVRELFNIPVFHGLMWESILYAKSLNIKFFETGIHSFTDDENISDKLLNISNFKRGYGGKLYVKPHLYI